MTSDKLPTLDDVRVAAARIAGHVHRTPVVGSATLDRQLGFRVRFKCENLQKVGAFKARGAVNAVLALDDERAARGVISHSSGNHAAALAYAAGIRGIPCTVVMPEQAPAIKVDAVRGYGAEIVFCERAERDETCERIRRRGGMTLIHPFENPRIIAGQGTAFAELVEDEGPFDAVIAPVGGGGLLSGTALAGDASEPIPAIWGAEPETVDDAYRSLTTGRLHAGVVDPVTLADGLMTGLGRPNFEILRARGVRVQRVTESEIVVAARFVLERMKLVVEPSAATVVAALRQLKTELRGLRVGAILSGGNTDFRWLCPEAGGPVKPRDAPPGRSG